MFAWMYGYIGEWHLVRMQGSIYDFSCPFTQKTTSRIFMKLNSNLDIKIHKIIFLLELSVVLAELWHDSYKDVAVSWPS